MSVDSLSVEDAVYFAKLAEQAERYEDMVMYMGRVVKKESELLAKSDQSGAKDIINVQLGSNVATPRVVRQRWKC